MTSLRHDAAEAAEILVARAKVSLLAAHAHAAHAIVLEFADRLPADRALSLYGERHRLAPLEAEYVKLHARARGRVPAVSMDGKERDAVSRVNGGAIRRSIHRVQDFIDPLHDPALRHDFDIAIARATAVVLAVHVRYAVRLTALLSPPASPATAVRRYLDRLGVAEGLRTAVAAFALSRIAGNTLLLPGLADGTRAP